MIFVEGGTIFHPKCWTCDCHNEIMDGIVQPMVTDSGEHFLECCDCNETFNWCNQTLVQVRRQREDGDDLLHWI